MAIDLTAQIVALQNAMASGVLTVEDADTGRITYRTYAEMRQALSDLLARQAEENADGFRPRRTRQIVMIGRSGW